MFMESSEVSETLSGLGFIIALEKKVVSRALYQQPPRNGLVTAEDILTDSDFPDCEPLLNLLQDWE